MTPPPSRLEARRLGSQTANERHPRGTKPTAMILCLPTATNASTWRKFSWNANDAIILARVPQWEWRSG